MSGWRRMPRQSESSELAAALHDAVGQGELADVVQQARGVGELLLAARHPELLGEVAGERGDGGAVARGARVALLERAHEARQDAPRQVRVLARALAGDDDEPQHVRERDDVEADEGQRDEADLGVDLRDDRDERAVQAHRGQQPGQAAEALRDRAPVEDRHQRGDDGEVQRHRRHRGAAISSDTNAGPLRGGSIAAKP